MLDADDKTISAIDQETLSPKGAPFSTSSTPTDIAAGAGALWIGNAFRELPFSSTSYPQSVSRLDPETRVVVDTIQPSLVPASFSTTRRAAGSARWSTLR